MDYTVHGILQARILEWVAFPFSRGIFPTQGWNPGFLHCRQILYQWSHKGSPFSRTMPQTPPLLKLLPTPTRAPRLFLCACADRHSPLLSHGAVSSGLTCWQPFAWLHPVPNTRTSHTVPRPRSAEWPGEWKACVWKRRRGLFTCYLNLLLSVRNNTTQEILFLITLKLFTVVDLKCHASFRCTAKLFIHVNMCIHFFQILFPYTLLQDIEYSSLSYIVGPCCTGNS